MGTTNGCLNGPCPDCVGKGKINAMFIAQESESNHSDTH